MKLKNKVALISGGSRGIGRSIAIAFAEEGADVILVARNQELLENVAEEVRQKGQRALPIPCDVSSSQAVQKLAAEVQESYDRLDILVNNAGISKRSKFLDYDDETWFEVIRINLFGVYLCTKAFLAMMQNEGLGRIINIASVAGKAPVPFNTAYGASKHGVLGLTKSLASELALSGYKKITVNAICPFFVDTDMFRGPQGYIAQMKKMSGQSEDELIKKIVGSNLQQRVLDSEEVASMALYLASDDARGVTGQAFNICGGRIFN
jgi:NAD(P)-dependent dehydrogenase (short-subunit alcohol dehydrogenase family)